MASGDRIYLGEEMPWLLPTINRGISAGGTAPAINTYSVFASDGDRYIYCVPGGNAATSVFSRLDTQTMNWATMAPLPVAVTNAQAVCWGGGDSIYMAAVSTLYRYSISGNSWAAVSSGFPALVAGPTITWNGADLLYLHTGGVQAMWRYHIPGNSWASLAIPDNNFTGSASQALYDGQDFIWITGGANSTYSGGFYCISGNFFSTLASVGYHGNVSTAAAVIPGQSPLYFTDRHLVTIRAGSSLIIMYDRFGKTGMAHAGVTNMPNWGNHPQIVQMKDGKIWLFVVSAAAAPAPANGVVGMSLGKRMK